MKNVSKILLVSLLLLFAIVSFAQNNDKTNKLKQVIKTSKGVTKVLYLDTLSRFFWDVNADSSIYYANLALNEAKIDKSNFALGEAYNSVGNAYSEKGNDEKAIEFYTKSKDYRLEEGKLDKVGDSYHNMGISALLLKKYSESISYYKQSAELYNKTGKKILEGITYNSIADIYKQLHELNKALEYALKALNILQEEKNDSYIANTYNFIGSIHADLKNLDLAQEYYQKAYDIWKKKNSIEGQTTGVNNLGTIFDEKGDHEKALLYYQKSLELAKQLKDSIGIATALNNIGYTFVKINQMEKAISAYESSLEISKRNKIYDSYMNTCNNLASAYLKVNNLNKAEYYLNVVLKNINKITELQFAEETYLLLSKLNERRGNYKKAFEYKNKQLIYNDSIFHTQQLQSIAEMQTRFETETREREIELLKKTNEVRELELDKQRNFKNILVLTTFLLLLLVASAFYILYVSRKANKLQSEKNKALETANKKLTTSEDSLRELNATKDKLFSIIAHDLKNPFNALIGFSDILDRNYIVLSDEERKEYIAIVNESAQSLFKLLDNLLQWTRTQTGTINYVSEHFKLLPIIRQEIANLNPNSEKKKIKITTNIDDKFEVFADKNSVSVIIRNLISNAIKFTDHNGAIKVNAEIKDNMAVISVKDSGIGISSDNIDRIFLLDGSISTKGTANESGTGLGLLLCKEFVEKNNGKIWVDSKKGEGSNFFFTLPLT